MWLTTKQKLQCLLSIPTSRDSFSADCRILALSGSLLVPGHVRGFLKLITRTSLSLGLLGLFLNELAQLEN